MSAPPDRPVHVGSEIVVRALEGLPVVEPGADLVELLAGALDATGWSLADGDVLCVASKVLSRAEGRFVDLATVEAGPEAVALAEQVGKEPALVELILRDSVAVSRAAPGVLIVRHRLGHVSANAGLDRSNSRPPDAPEGTGPWLLTLPGDPDATAEEIRAGLQRRFGARVGVVVSDSLGRPFRMGTVGAALGVAGLPGLVSQVGREDLFGRPLEYTYMALGDMVAATADMVMGQSGEGRGAVVVRGIAFEPGPHTSAELRRPPQEDLYA